VDSYVRGIRSNLAFARTLSLCRLPDEIFVTGQLRFGTAKFIATAVPLAAHFYRCIVLSTVEVMNDVTHPA